MEFDKCNGDLETHKRVARYKRMGTLSTTQLRYNFFLESYVKYETEWLLDINYIPLLQASHCIYSVKCYCIPIDDCFNINMDFDFKNCWLAIDKPRLHNWPLMLIFEAFNQAMLSSNITRYEVHICTLTYQYILLIYQLIFYEHYNITNLFVSSLHNKSNVNDDFLYF